MGSFTDDEIRQFLDEPKTLPLDWVSKMRRKDKTHHKECFIEVKGDLEFEGENGVKSNMYRILLRQHIKVPLNFTAIFSLFLPNTDELLNIKRYCGKYHQHTNRIEDVELPLDFHIHTATYRYQESRFDNDAYAEVTERYNDINGALKCLLEDCNFKLAVGQQLPLNGWVSI